MSGPSGILIAAPASGSGKTLVTLALLRALRRRGIRVASLKVGPDYIDPAFHSAATGRACLNLDGWAMRPATMARVLEALARDGDVIVGEGVMGLFDGAAGGAGSTAAVSKTLGWPVVLVVDAQGMAGSVAALLNGFVDYDPAVRIAGVIFNRIGGEGHARLLREAAAEVGVPVLGCLPRNDALSLPSRHLGLVQAGEHRDLDTFLEKAAEWAATHLDLDAVVQGAARAALTQPPAEPPLPPLGQRIAVAKDEAFAFSYPIVLEGWRQAGAEVTTFSPLADQAPDPRADSVYLPGGYPELHADRLAANEGFLGGLRAAADCGAAVFGECGGYMVLGEALRDAEGRDHAMAGLLPLATSFAERRLTLGYREVTAPSEAFAGNLLRGHEFHFATILSEGPGDPLFEARDSAGKPLGHMGMRQGRVCGSFVHLIDTVDTLKTGR